MIGAVRTYQKLNVPQETARQYIMEEFGKSEEEADALLSAYWRYNVPYKVDTTS